MTKYCYTIFFDKHSATEFAEFYGTGYHFNETENTWHFTGERGNELVANGSDVSYFRIEPLTVSEGAQTA